MADRKLISASILMLISLVFLSGVLVVSSASGNGSVTFTVDEYTVTGDLTGAAIGHGGAVQMLMSVDQTIPTSYGAVQVSGDGIWIGETDFHTISGVIENLTGTVQGCAVFYCQTVDFTGNGTWGGTMSWSSSAGSQGSGTFESTLSFTGIQLNQTGPVQIPGNWTAAFET